MNRVTVDPLRVGSSFFGSIWLLLACSSSGSADPSPAIGGVAGSLTSMGGRGGSTSSGGQSVSNAGSSASGASSGGGGASTSGGSAASGGAPAGSSAGGSAGASAGMGVGGAAQGGSGGGSCSGPVGTIAGPLATGVVFMDTDGQRVNAHGGGIIREGDTFYLHGELFSSTSTANNFVGFSMYSSKDLATWKNEGIILPTQASGELGPNRKGERPHIIKCPSTGEFVLYAHAASEDYQTDKEVVYATSATVNGQYSYKGPLKNSAGTLAVHSDMSAYADDTGAYVLTESGHVYTLTQDCHGWVSDKSYVP